MIFNTEKTRPVGFGRLWPTGEKPARKSRLGRLPRMSPNRDTGKGTALVFGVTGIAGSYIARHLVEAGWTVVGVTRRIPRIEGWARSPRMTYLEADLTRPLDLPELDGRSITHAVYAVFASSAGQKWDAVSDLNAQIFANVMRFADAHLPNLRRVLKMQGQKYYGNHLGPYRTPAREDDPRHPGRNFYFDQQDLMVGLEPDRPWTYCILRPHVLVGTNTHALMNPLMVMGAYVSLCKYLGRPFSFPGDPVAYDTIYQATDADLLGRGAVWAMDAPGAANEVFNITNGDFFRWRHIWERVADAMDVPLGDPEPMPFAPFLEEHKDVWRQLAEIQGLDQPDVFKLVDWAFGDYIFRCAWDIMASTIKIRLHGFGECRDSEEMFVTRLKELQDAKVLPVL
jgi:nucleoside-diphosphate-sugar epimerase